MDRKKFIKNSLFIGAGLGLGAASSLETAKKGMHKVCIYDNYIRGVQYYQKEIETIDFSNSPTVELIREKDNHYDSFAIAVYANHHKIGYIAAYENIVLANLIDEGATLSIKVKENPDGTFYSSLFVQVFMEIPITPKTPLFADYTIRRADDAVDEYREGFRF